MRAKTLPGFAGRIEEREVLSAAVASAIDRRPCAVFVHGEAGVGKTRLVRAVCDEALAKSAAVLWGRCVRFGAVDAPYVALVGALEAWLDAVDAAERFTVLSAVPEAAELLPSRGGHPTQSMVRLLSAVDGLIQALVSVRPVVLVVDDVQWADPGSRDAITYLVAGFRSQRLVVLVTYRDEELVVGHPMHTWLADLLRLPSVLSLRLDRMSRDETEEQLSLLLGGRPEPRLVTDVSRRSAGNPYLTELLVEGLSAADDHLPVDLPGELTGALRAAWHGLAAPSREVMRVLAVGGRPVGAKDLTEVAAARGIGAEAVTTALVEASNTGICAAPSAETCWFRHPLLAEVLEATFVPGEAAPIHAAWAKTLEGQSSVGIGELRRVGDLALHYEGAHDPQRCLEMSLRAADLARDLKALDEEAVHLGRAARLWPTIPHSGQLEIEGELDLLERLGAVCDLVGDGDAAFAAWNRALELVDEQAAPLRTSRILGEHAWVAGWTGRRTGQPFAASARAVKLCEPFPDSPEYASALADLSECHSWTDSFDAALRYAEEAVQAAHRSGSHEALARAYRARSYARPRDKRADQDSAEALSQARMHSDPGLLTAARVGRQNYLADRGQLADTIELDAAGLSDALDTGVVNLAAYHAGALARSLLIVGRFSEANRTIRQGLGLARMPHNGAQVRLAAAQLAVRQGDLSRAGMHLRRAKELMPDLEERPNLFSPPTIAEYLVASGRPAEALELLARTLAVQIADPRVADEMLMWAARSAADLAEHAADRRDGGGLTQARRLLDDIVSLRKGLAPPPFERLTTEDLILPAFEALYAAENARCRARTPMSAIWEHATHRCASAGMRWEEAVASYRWAQALLTESAGRAAFAGPLRSAYSLAVELGATPLQQQAETLAGLGKLALDEPKEPSIQEIPETFRALTQREREILSHLVAGRTYAEIADSLFISKKTVSVHVSNLLRKTGTSSRLEVSAIAARLGYP